MTIATLVFTALSICAYLAIGFSRASKARDESQYFIANQGVSTQDYANVSVGYALQMAAMFLFASWGFVYGVGCAMDGTVLGLRICAALSPPPEVSRISG
jgi:hypothetical protein